MKLWYTHPAAEWNEALPLGNGRMGAMDFGGTAVELFALNEDSVWYGGFRNRVNPDAREAMPEIRRLLRQDRIREAQALAECAVTATPDGERHYEPLCNLVIQQLDGGPLAGLHGMRDLNTRNMTGFERPVSDYRRELDLTEGVFRVEYTLAGRPVRREAFVSFPHQVLAIRCVGHPFRALLRRGPYMTELSRQDRGRGRTLPGCLPGSGRWRTGNRQHADVPRKRRSVRGRGHQLPL